ncbi:MAG: tagaturonate reductase, partial [Planctomycetes bacterium]|nr:tagaturonate reductase [Planctomycetota bacterium]
LPSLKDYLAAKDTLPARLAFSLAALIVFYRGEWQGESYVGMRSDSEYPIRDDVSVLKALDSAWNQYGEDPAALARAVLADTTLWDEDLTAIPGLAESVANSLKNILAKGIRGALSVAARNNNE